MATTLIGTAVAVAGMAEYVNSTNSKHHSKGLGVTLMVVGVVMALAGLAI